MKIRAFTLAEVLITLGIIGIVAAMTFPILMTKYNYKITETRLKKFYTSINQAVLLAEAKYGDKKYWYQDLKGAQIDSDGKPVEGSSEAEKWFKMYLGSNMNVLHYSIDNRGCLIVYFVDGSALQQKNQKTTRDWIFYPSKADKCIEKYNYNIRGYGVCMFPFNFLPVANADYQEIWKYHLNRGFEPWKYKWDGTQESLYEGCKRNGGNADDPPSPYFCTALIQSNGWTIPKDYPKKISY